MSRHQNFHNERLPERMAFLAILGLSAAAVALPQPPPLACGDLIQTSIKLTHDLGPCPGDGIRIAAATPLTLDLNGHRIIGQGSGDGVSIFGESVVVKGPGRIVNFAMGIRVNHGMGVMIYDLDLVRNVNGIALVSPAMSGSLITQSMVATGEH